MRALTVLALTLTLSAVATAFPKSHQLEGYSFEQWAQEAGRAYPTSEEHSRRKAIFEERLVAIKKHNADPSQTWRRGVNQFSDWTAEEFKKYNTYKRPVTGSFQDGIVGYYYATGSPVPNSVDYRRASPAVLTGVKNQGACGSCWAHSATETLESAFAIKYGQLPVLSQQQITSCDWMMSGCGGGDAFDAWLYVMGSQGLYEEWTYPYTDFFAKNDTYEATSRCKDIRKEWLPNFGWYPKANVSAIWFVASNNATATMEALAFRGPLSVSVGASGWNDYESGIFSNPPGSQGPWEIDHGVQMVGYGHDEDVNKNYWIVRNSWGTTWGEEGYIRLYRPADEPCGTADGQESCGTSGVLNGPGYPEAAMLSTLN